MIHKLSIAILGIALTVPVDAQKNGQFELPVTARMDIFRAGGYNDGSDGIAPTVYSFGAKAGRVLSFSSVSGEWTCSNAIAPFGPDGTTNGLCAGYSIMNPVGTLAGYNLTDFAGALAGVFLEDELPVVARPPLRFFLSDAAQGGTKSDFRVLRPKIGQIFFIGDGLTGTGTGSIQGFEVPSTATHLYLGFVDSCTEIENASPGCYSDNVGTLDVIFRLENRDLDWLKPELPVSPPDRCCGGMAYDTATSSTVLFGGGNGGIAPPMRFGDTWTFRNGWTMQTPANSPPALQGPGMAYDAHTGTVVLFGGNGQSGYYSGTWTWDGVTWTQQFPPVSPLAREFDSQAMVYDPALGKVVLFGGNSPNGPLADTWEWDGESKTWTQKFPLTSPAARTTTLAYDAARRNVVLFGGSNSDPVFFNDTWTWDGVNWTEHPTASAPAGRTFPAMVFDSDIDELVLFGGFFTPGQGLDDTWIWNGTNWTQLDPRSSPGGRWATDMVYDPLASGLLLFGGEVTGDPFANDTWFFKLVPVP